MADHARCGPTRRLENVRHTRATGRRIAIGHDARRPRPCADAATSVKHLSNLTVRRTANRSREQIADAFLQNLVGRYTDRVQEALGFEVFVKLRQGERGIPSEVAAQVPTLVANDNRLQHTFPVIGRVDVAGTEGTPFHIAELVKQA